MIELDVVAQKANLCNVELAFQALHCNSEIYGKKSKSTVWRNYVGQSKFQLRNP